MTPDKSVAGTYGLPIEDLPIPAGYRVAGFAPPKPRQLIFSVLSWTVEKATAQFDDSCPRLILEEVEPCEECGEAKPVVLVEIKTSERARNYHLKLLCAECIAANQTLLKNGC